MKKTVNYRANIEALRFQYLKGKITLDQFREQVNPMVKEMNEKGKIVANKYGMKFKPFTFEYLTR
jgi:hypothetical protein